MTTSKLKFDIVPSNPAMPVGVEVWVGPQCILDLAQCTESHAVDHNVDDTVEQQHVVKIVLKNKTAEHTRVDDQGAIVSDSVLEIKNFAIDDIDIDQVVREQAVYCHDFNGTGTETTDSFYNTAGCNGTVILEFSTPVYLWLLEKM
jgi:hypothetical protein